MYRQQRFPYSWPSRQRYCNAQKRDFITLTVIQFFSGISERLLPRDSTAGTVQTVCTVVRYVQHVASSKTRIVLCSSKTVENVDTCSSVHLDATFNCKHLYLFRDTMCTLLYVRIATNQHCRPKNHNRGTISVAPFPNRRYDSPTQSHQSTTHIYLPARFHL